MAPPASLSLGGERDLALDAELPCDVAQDGTRDAEVQRLKHRLKEVTTISTLAHGFVRGRDLAHVLQRVADGAAALMECEGAAVVMRSPERPTLEIVATTGVGAELVGALLPLHGSLAGWVVESGRPRLSSEPTDELFGAGAVRVRDALVVPLIGGAEAFGAIAVFDRRRTEAYAPHEIALLMDLAHHAEAAIEARRTLEALRRQVAESRALAEVGRAVTSTLALEGVLSLVLREAEALVSAECSSVALCEGEEDERLTVRAATGALGAWSGAHLPMRGSLMGQAVRQREPALADVLPFLPEATGAAPPEGPAAAVPLVAAGCVRGALLVVRAPDAPPLGARDVEALRRLAAFAAIAIDNARLYHAEKETADALHSRVELLSALLETGNRLRLEMDVQALLQTICEAICSVLGWRYVVLSLRDYETGTSAPAAAAGYTPEKCAEILAIRPVPIREIEFRLQERYRISSSYFVAHTEISETTGPTHLITTSPEVPDSAAPGEWHPHDVLLVPIELRGTVLGFISPDEPKSGRVPSLEEVQALELFANQAAVAIDNARLYQAEREMTDALRAQRAELEHAYQTLHQSQEQLLVSEKMAALGRITAGIAHEINSPLGGILNSLELARTYAVEYRDSAGDAEVSADDHRAIAGDLMEALSLAEGATRKVAQFVRSIKAQTRPPADAPSSAFDPAREVDATLGLLHHQLRDRKVQMHLETAEGLELDGDPGQFALLVQNLISNAIDAYEGRPGEVWVRLFRHEASVVLEVADRGCGIPEAIRGRIFDYLFTTKEVGRGTGLGLSMAHNIVSGHFRGEITLQSQPGHGTTFRVRLPARRG
jgi:signal transduction histidine kinase